MPGHIEINELIRKEADSILFEKGLLSVLKNYGIPYVTGSYALDLMTWRDLDIYLQTDNISGDDFFRMGAAINNLLHPVKMSFRNEKIGQTKGLPHGLYWGVYLGDERKDAWKIDCWVMNAEECQRSLQFCDDISERLTAGSRQAILAIKSECWQDPDYRRSYSSRDIYDAVLNKGITTIDDFRKYLSFLQRQAF